MNARIIHSAHINALVNFAHHKMSAAYAWDILPRRHSPRELGNALRTQNLRSVWELQPGAVLPAPTEYVWRSCPHVVQTAAFLKLLDSYEAQSSHTSDWFLCDVGRVIDNLRREAIKLLPGYAAAPAHLEIDLATPAVSHLLSIRR